MGFVPQTNNVFTSMTVEENLEMGAFIRRDDIADTMAQVFDCFRCCVTSAASRPGAVGASASRLLSGGR